MPVNVEIPKIDDDEKLAHPLYTMSKEAALLPTEDRDIALAILTASNINEFMPKQFPTQPKEYRDYMDIKNTKEYSKLASAEKSKTWQRFSKEPQFIAYVLQCERIDDENHSNWSWLMQCGKVLKDANLIQQMQIVAKAVNRFNTMLRPLCCTQYEHTKQNRVTYGICNN